MSEKTKRRKKREVRAALVVFNTLSNGNEYWGDISTSRFSAALEKSGVKNDLYLLLLRGQDESSNRKNIQLLIKKIRSENYSFVIFSSQWLPWIKNEIQESCRDIDISELLDMEEMQKLANKNSGVARAIELTGVKHLEGNNVFFELNTTFIVIGGDSRAKHTVSDVLTAGCDFVDPIRDNYFYKSMDNNPHLIHKGCSYCHAAKEFLDETAESRKEMLFSQTMVLLETITSLQKIQLPHPQKFFDILPDTIDRLKLGV